MSERDGDGGKAGWGRGTALLTLAGTCFLGLLPRRGAWMVAAGAALAAGGVVAVSLGDHFFGDPAHFSAARWRAGGPEQRGRMAADLCQGGILRGKSRADVLDLLGEPDRAFRDSVEYDLLPNPASRRPEWVAVQFDRTSGQVIDVKIQD